MIAVQQMGTGPLTVVGAAGVAINGATPGAESLVNLRYISTGVLRRVSSNVWVFSGSVAE